MPDNMIFGDFDIKKYIASGIILSTLLACSDSGTISDIDKNKELIVLTRNAPTTCYEGRDGITGPEYDLVNSFASYNNLNVRFVIIDSIDEMLDAIRNDKAHLIAAGITITDKRKTDDLKFAESYQKVQQLMVCRRGKGLPRTINDLPGLKIVVIDGSSYVETLQDLQAKTKDLQWEVSNEDSTEQLLEKVWQKKIDCTLADSNIVSAHP